MIEPLTPSQTTLLISRALWATAKCSKSLSQAESIRILEISMEFLGSSSSPPVQVLQLLLFCHMWDENDAKYSPDAVISSSIRKHQRKCTHWLNQVGACRAIAALSENVKESIRIDGLLNCLKNLSRLLQIEAEEILHLVLEAMTSVWTSIHICLNEAY